MATIDRSDDIREREKIAREIAKTSKSIRKKLRALKTGKIEKDIELDMHFKPLVGPLRKIADNSSLIAVKKEESDSDTEIYTLPSQQREEEEDATSRKRKRPNSWLDLSPTPRKSDQSKAPLDVPSASSPPITSAPSTTVRTVQPTMPKSLTNEAVFESAGESLATSIQKKLLTSEGRQEFLETLRNTFGPLGQEYIGAFLSGGSKSGIDHSMYGVYFDKDVMMLGNKRFNVEKDDVIIIDGIRYGGTPGIYELIFKKIPDEDIYTEEDMKKYKSILLATSLHKFKYNPVGRIQGNIGHKYKHIIQKLIPTESQNKKSGKGLFVPRAMILTDNKIDYVHWDDPNELVDRLRLLDASRQAGHNAHDNEIQSIIEELREAGLIIN